MSLPKIMSRNHHVYSPREAAEFYLVQLDRLFQIIGLIK